MLRKNIIWAVSLSLAVALSVTLVLIGSPVDTRVADAAMMRDADAVRGLIRHAGSANLHLSVLQRLGQFGWL